MPVTTPHFFGLMPHEAVNQPLVDATSCQVGSKRMPETMPAWNLGLLVAIQQFPELPGELVRLEPFLVVFGEQKAATGMLRQPAAKHCL